MLLPVAREWSWLCPWKPGGFAAEQALRAAAASGQATALDPHSRTADSSIPEGTWCRAWGTYPNRGSP